MKTCTKCNEAKQTDAFCRNKKSKDGRNWHCRACVKRHRDANREAYAAKASETRAHPDSKARRAEWWTNYYTANRDAILAQRRGNAHVWWEYCYRTRAEKYGFSELIDSMQSFTKDQLVERWGDSCYRCGGEWDQLDHATPVARGGAHSLDNCRPCCGPCNRKAWAEVVAHG